MELHTTRIIDAPIDRVWSLQLAHDQWPAHLAIFTRVVRKGDVQSFGRGSVVTITQPGLGTVDWTVTRFDEEPGERSFAWTARSRGASYEGRHEVIAEDADHTRLTLTLTVAGGMTKLVGTLLRARMQKAIEREATAFQRWSTEA